MYPAPVRAPLRHLEWRRLTLDWLAPAVILGIGSVNVALHPRSAEYPGPPAVHLTFLAAALVALGLRRRSPVLAPLLAVFLTTVWVAEMWPVDAQGPFEGFLVLIFATYAIAAGNSGSRLTRATVLLVAFFIVGQVVMIAFGGGVGDPAPVVVWMSVAWIVGFVLARRGEQASAARTQAAALSAEHERRTAEAVDHERSRIARELHDVVAHSLSVIVVQSAAERRAWRHGTADGPSTESVLESVERTGREAMVDLRRLLGLLRSADEPATLRPQPTLADVDCLVEHARRTGLDVRLCVEGRPRVLPAGVDLSAYRIVQEALTNVVKHAKAESVDVVVRYDARQVRVDVKDDGRGSSDPDLSDSGAGQGLVGMRERAGVYGGELFAGPDAAGGWTVRACLPIESAAAVPKAT